MKRALFVFAVMVLLVGVPRLAFAQAEPSPLPSQGGEKGARHGFSMSADAGFAFRQVYNVPIYAGDFEVGFGGAFKSVSVYGTFGILYGETSAGLSTTRVGVGANLLFPISGRVRLGIEPRSTLFTVRRVTEQGSMGGFGLGLYAASTFDLVELEPWWLYAGVRLGVDTYLGAEPTALLWGGTFSLGARY